MRERIVVVEDAFVATGKGVLVAPRFTLKAGEAAPRGSFSVVLKLPDGSERTVHAQIEVSHMRGPLPPFAMIRLPELTPEDVPKGSEIWRVGDEQTNPNG